MSFVFPVHAGGFDRDESRGPAGVHQPARRGGAGRSVRPPLAGPVLPLRDERRPPPARRPADPGLSLGRPAPTGSPLGGALEPTEPGPTTGRPRSWPGTAGSYMVVSFGDVDRTRACPLGRRGRPARGPVPAGQADQRPGRAFSIDGSWLLDDDGRLYLFRCLDFVDDDDPPHGTGIVVQPMRDPFTPVGPAGDRPPGAFPLAALRAQPARCPSTAAGRSPSGPRSRGPRRSAGGPGTSAATAAGITRRAYGTGEAVADAPARPLRRPPRPRRARSSATTPGLVEGPGHFSVVRPDLVHDWIVLHGRRPGEPVRRVWLCPASWGRDGVDDRRPDRPAPAGPPPAATTSVGSTARRVPPRQAGCSGPATGPRRPRALAPRRPGATGSPRRLSGLSLPATGSSRPTSPSPRRATPRPGCVRSDLAKSGGDRSRKPYRGAGSRIQRAADPVASSPADPGRRAVRPVTASMRSRSDAGRAGPVSGSMACSWRPPCLTARGAARVLRRGPAVFARPPRCRRPDLLTAARAITDAYPG